MIEWVVLVLLVPVILIPVVLLFGFAGCNWFFGLEETFPAPQKAFEATLAQDRQRSNLCIVQRIESVRLFASGSPVRITVQRPTTGMLVINSLFISQAADTTDPTADPYDSAADLRAVLAAPLQVLPDATQPHLELEPVDYHLDQTKPLLLAFDIGDASVVARSDSNVPDTEARAFFGPLGEAGMNNRSSGYQAETRIQFITRIDIG